jgi:hypothetical protein
MKCDSKLSFTQTTVPKRAGHFGDLRSSEISYLLTHSHYRSSTHPTYEPLHAYEISRATSRSYVFCAHSTVAFLTSRIFLSLNSLIFLPLVSQPINPIFNHIVSLTSVNESGRNHPYRKSVIQSIE